MSDFGVCTRCVMDASDHEIVFDDDGICNHCKMWDAKTRPIIESSFEEKKEGLQRSIDEIKNRGSGSVYDCVLGLSGGMDSSYLAWIAWQNGLKTKVVHLDNGWDSETAMGNIERILKRTGFSYENYIIDWEEFRDIQRAYLKASVIDVEVPSDMAIRAVMAKESNRFGIKSFIVGSNPYTESVMGSGWTFSKKDSGNLIRIHRKFGERTLKTFPFIDPLDQLVMRRLGDLREYKLLHWANCDQQYIQSRLKNDFNWRDPGVKHGESEFTRFYQLYILPKKFRVDKRRAHLSSQVLSGQISRDEALKELGKPLFRSQEEEERLYDYCVKKLGFSREEFEQIMLNEPVGQDTFGVNKPEMSIIRRARYWLLSGLIRGMAILKSLMGNFSGSNLTI